MIRLHENWILHSSSPTKFCDTLVQGNVIMCANITLPLTLVLNKPNIPFLSMYFNYYCLQVYFWRMMPKFSVNLEIISHKNQYPIPICNFGFNEPQYSDKCWSNLLLKCHIFFTCNTHMCITCAIIWFMLWLVWSLEAVTMCWCDSIINDIITVTSGLLLVLGVFFFNFLLIILDFQLIFKYI